MHRVDAVENSPRVRREHAEGIGSLLGWRKEVHQKKTETHRKIIGVAKKLAGNDGPRSSLSIELGFGRYSGISLKFARRFVEGIGKLAGNTPGDRRKKTERLTARMAEAAGLVGAAEPPRADRVWSSPKEDRYWTPVCLKKEDLGVGIGLWR
ncbi:hypothetical protein BHM03_00049664 [Ensete ventricosum]|nr:hypothetical protein BHM03_00049664 [Ensete ventricosum]